MTESRESCREKLDQKLRGDVLMRVSINDDIDSLREEGEGGGANVIDL